MDTLYWDFTDKNLRPHILYCSYGSLKDPDHDPGKDNKHTADILTFVKWEEFTKWKDTSLNHRPEDYKALKVELENRLMEEIKIHRPELYKLIDHHELSTPLTTFHYDKAPLGGIYGLDSNMERYANTNLKCRTPLENFYLSGVDIYFPGFVSAIFSGLGTAAAIDRRVFR